MAKQEKFTNNYWDKKGNGKYQADYDRLVKQLVPTKKKGSKAETLAGEIMRAVTKTLASFCNKTGNSSHSFDAINFLAMAGIFGENDDALATIHPYVKKQTKGGGGAELLNGNRYKVQIAIRI